MNRHITIQISMHRREVCKTWSQYQRLMGDSSWWERRAELLDRYTAPCLRAQTAEGYEVVLTLPWAEYDKSGPVRAVAGREGWTVLRERWRPYNWACAPQYWPHFCCNAEQLVWIQCAGDDLYRLDFVENLLAMDPRDGETIYCTSGYIFDTRDGRMAHVENRRNPWAFWADVYGSEALASPEAFGAYRREHGFECYHHQKNNQPHTRIGPEDSFCILSHEATHSGRRWDGKRLQDKITGWVDPRVVLPRFGVRV